MGNLIELCNQEDSTKKKEENSELLCRGREKTENEDLNMKGKSRNFIESGDENCNFQIKQT